MFTVKPLSSSKINFATNVSVKRSVQAGVTSNNKLPLSLRVGEEPFARIIGAEPLFNQIFIVIALFAIGIWLGSLTWDAKADLYAERVKQKLKEDPDFKKTNVDKIDPKKLKLDVPA
jgi:hypothetical protein